MLQWLWACIWMCLRQPIQPRDEALWPWGWQDDHRTAWRHHSSTHGTTYNYSSLHISSLHFSALHQSAKHISPEHNCPKDHHPQGYHYRSRWHRSQWVGPGALLLRHIETITASKRRRYIYEMSCFFGWVRPFAGDPSKWIENGHRSVSWWNN